MDAHHYFHLLRNVRDVAMATTDAHGQAQVRIASLLRVTEDCLFFVAARGSAFHEQLTRSGTVALAGLSRNSTMIRLEGKVRNHADRELVAELLEENPDIRDIFLGETWSILDPFCIYQGNGESLSLARLPVSREYFSFGGGIATPRGYWINATCIECGVCSQVCPEDCIEPGTPFFIDSRHCIHCGACMENCPAEAVERFD